MDTSTEILTNIYHTANPVPGNVRTNILTVSDQAYGWIRQQLFKTSETSQRLSDLAIATKLQISRTPVRQALDRLAMEGLINSDPGRGYSTRIFTRQDVEEIYDLWETNEVLALRLAWPHIPKEELRFQLKLIDNVWVRLLKPDEGLHFEPDFQFHNFLITYSGNSRLVRYLATLLSQVNLLQVNYNFYSSRMDEILKDQAQILNVLLEDMPTEAYGLLSRLIQKSKMELLQEMKSNLISKPGINK